MTLNAAPVAHAATITADGTTCTLVDAITAANSDSPTGGCPTGSGDDIIQLPSSGTVTLTSANEADPDGYGAVGLPPITTNITIEGNGTTITRSGGNNFRLFYVKSGGSLTLENLTLSNGLAQGGNGGGQSQATGGGGGAGLGGAIYNRGNLTLTGVTLTANSAQGGDGSNDSGTNAGGGGGGGLGGDGNDSTNHNGANGGGVNGGAGGTSGSPEGKPGGIGGGGGGAHYSPDAVGGPGGFGGGGGGATYDNAGNVAGGSGGFGGGGGGHQCLNNTCPVNSTMNNGFGGGDADVWVGGGGAGMGGAIFNDIGTVNITNSTLSSNTAQGGNGGSSTYTATGGSGYGGALFNYNGTVTVNNATFSDNTVATGTGGSPDTPAGGGIYNYQESGTANLTLKNTILANTTSGTDCENNAGTVTAPAANSNLIESNNGCGTPAVTSDPNLGSLADNGGPTFTHALQASSLAIDAGDTTNGGTASGGCVASDGSTIARDQRNAPRAQGTSNGGASCDIGAYEYNSTPLVVTLASFQALATGEQVVVTWQTVSEVHNLGFNLYRSTTFEGAQEQLNDSLIPAQAPGSGQGGAYEFVDEQVEDGSSYYYWLEDVDIEGTTSLHGPVSATTNTPTAVTLEGLTIDVPTISLWGLISLMLMLLMGGWMWRRSVQ